MRVITEPRVELVGASNFFGHSEYHVPDSEDASVQLGAFAAKGCYDSFGENGRSCEENQLQIISSRHGSVLEHISASLFIEGITRGCSLELNRHRHFAISQRSTRYTAEEDAAIVLEPYYAGIYKTCWNTGADQRDREFMDRHLLAAQNAVEQYQFEVRELVAMNPVKLEGVELRKWARGKARNILPHALETRGTWTGNVRAWRHFIETRSERHAESEIRRLSNAVFHELLQWAPLYFEDYTAEMVDGFNEYVTEYRKV